MEWYNLKTSKKESKYKRIKILRGINSTAIGYDLITLIIFEDNEKKVITNKNISSRTMRMIYNNPNKAYFEKFIAYPVYIRLLHNFNLGILGL